MLSPLTRLVGDGAAAVKVLARTGLIAPVRPDRLVGMGLSIARWGSSPAGAYAAGAARGAEEAPSLPPPGRDGRHVILTSGTTGKPKGAARSAPSALAGLVQLVSVLEAIPYRARGVTVLAAPAFHAWGLANLTLGMGMQSTLVMSRRFDPARTLELVEKHGADTLVAVPVMVQRLLELPERERQRFH